MEDGDVEDDDDDDDDAEAAATASSSDASSCGRSCSMIWSNGWRNRVVVSTQLNVAVMKRHPSILVWTVLFLGMLCSGSILATFQFCILVRRRHQGCGIQLCNHGKTIIVGSNAYYIRSTR